MIAIARDRLFNLKTENNPLNITRRHYMRRTLTLTESEAPLNHPGQLMPDRRLVGMTQLIPDRQGVGAVVSALVRMFRSVTIPKLDHACKRTLREGCNQEWAFDL